MTSLAIEVPIPAERPRLGWTARIARRLATGLVVLLSIAFLTYWGLTMAENALQSLPVDPAASAITALQQTLAHLLDHPTTYVVHREPLPFAVHILTLLRNSLALLVPALALAFVGAIPLGLRAARSGSRRAGSVVWLISILGISVPAFMLAMFLWVVNLEAARRFSLTPLPATGLGFDLHLLLPVLVLSARPFAQLTQVTYITLRDLLDQDFVRTARGKGVPRRSIDRRHILRNAWIPILTSLSTSLRFALATLPVVETFFVWPGIGLGLLEAIVAGEKAMAVDMALALGLVFLLVNSTLELVYPLLDPRLREVATGADPREAASLRQTLVELFQRWRDSLLTRTSESPEAPSSAKAEPRAVAGGRRLAEPDRPADSMGWRRAVLTDPVFLVALVLALVLLGLVGFGSRLTEASPYVANGVMVIEGEIGVPPYPPSSVFPWGTDQIGRDMQALVLYGARQTLSLALLVVAARLAVGVVGGMTAGWWQGGWFDRVVLGVLSVWAAFPITLFAMILILAIGIERGMPTFVLALCFVGWGEIAQYVRSEVIGLRGKPFLEGARAVGVPPEGVLLRHILPNLAPSILVLAALEMGAVLLLLAELGFLGIFLGGGYRVMLGEAGRMVPVIAHYSDVPEWSALLANIRLWWRSYPWLAWSPAVAFSLAILTFNLSGEAMRRIFERSRVSPARWVNRSTVVGAVVVMLGAAWIFNTTAPLGVYVSQADLFSADRAMAVIEELSLPRYGGRETGTEGAELAAQFIAAEMESIGLFPGGQRVPGGPIETYFSARPSPRLHLVGAPTLEVIDPSGHRQAMTYRDDFSEYPLGNPPGSPFSQSAAGDATVSGMVVGLSAGPPPEGADLIPSPGSWAAGDVYGLGRMDLRDKILLIRESFVPYLPGGESAGILVVPDDPARLKGRYLFPGLQSLRPGRRPVGAILMIHPALADRLLEASGSSLADLDRNSRELRPGEVSLTGEGVEVAFEIPVEMGPDLEEKYISVIGYIPGQGAEMGLDDDVILVSAYYDGLGTAPDGTLYPGANDNLSGVAVMLELARILQEGPYAPDKTLVFVAWAGGERWEGFSVVDAMSAKIGFNLLNVEAVIELSGVGGGSGEAIALGQGTSFRLTRLIEAAAARTGVRVTTRGTDPHFGLPRAIGFGQRDALSAYVSWDGSGVGAHLPTDIVANLDPEALDSVGRTMSLVLTVLSRETEY